MIRLLSVAATSVGMLLSGASLVVPPVPTALAQVAATTNRGAPEPNPYEDSTQCVYGAWQFAAEAGHRLPWFAGNATDWKEGAQGHGLEVIDTISPDVVHSVAVWGPGVGGASQVGHVGWVERVDGNRFLVKDRNWIPAADDERWVTWQDGISFIVLEEPQPTPPPLATPEPAAPGPGPAPIAGLAPLGAPACAVDAAQFALAGEARLAQPWAPSEPLTGPWAGLPLMGVAGQQPDLPVAQP